jgi:hypothetical protein
MLPTKPRVGVDKGHRIRDSREISYTHSISALLPKEISEDLNDGDTFSFLPARILILSQDLHSLSINVRLSDGKWNGIPHNSNANFFTNSEGVKI